MNTDFLFYKGEKVVLRLQSYPFRYDGDETVFNEVLSKMQENGLSITNVNDQLSMPALFNGERELMKCAESNGTLVTPVHVLRKVSVKKNDENGLEKWDETQHPRGQPKNAGQFSAAPGAREKKAEHAQLQGLRRQAVAPKGGFTYRVATGRSPTEGLALSIMPEFGERIPFNKFSGDSISAFMEKNKELLASDPRCHVGAWRDHANNEIDLDISVVLGRDDHETAVALCRQHNQEAYWSIHENKEYHVGARDNPAMAGINKAAEPTGQTRYLLPPNPTPAEIDEFVATIRNDGSVTKFIDVVNGGGDGNGGESLGKLEWDETQHPRGQPKNKGQFSKKPGGGRGQGREDDERSMLPGARERGQMGGRSAVAPPPPVDPNLSAPPVGAEMAMGGAARRRAQMAAQDAARAARRQGVQDAARQQIEQARVQREQERQKMMQVEQANLRTIWQTLPIDRNANNEDYKGALGRLTDGIESGGDWQGYGTDSSGRQQWTKSGRDRGVTGRFYAVETDNGIDAAIISDHKVYGRTSVSSLDEVAPSFADRFRVAPPPVAQPPAPAAQAAAPAAPAAVPNDRVSSNWAMENRDMEPDNDNWARAIGLKDMQGYQLSEIAPDSEGRKQWRGVSPLATDREYRVVQGGRENSPFQAGYFENGRRPGTTYRGDSPEEAIENLRNNRNSLYPGRVPAQFPGGDAQAADAQAQQPAAQQRPPAPPRLREGDPDPVNPNNVVIGNEGKAIDVKDASDMTELVRSGGGRRFGAFTRWESTGGQPFLVGLREKDASGNSVPRTTRWAGHIIASRGQLTSHSQLNYDLQNGDEDTRPDLDSYVHGYLYEDSLHFSLDFAGGTNYKRIDQRTFGLERVYKAVELMDKKGLPRMKVYIHPSYGSDQVLQELYTKAILAGGLRKFIETMSESLEKLSKIIKVTRTKELDDNGHK